MGSSLRWFVLSLPCITWLACAGSEPLDAIAEGDQDAGVDLERDGSSVRDAGHDANARPDAKLEAGADAGPDDEPDASSEADADAAAPVPCIEMLTLDTAPGAVTERIFSQCDETLDRPVAPSQDYDTCRVGGPFPLATFYKYVVVYNPSGASVRIELRLDDAETPSWKYVYLATYAAEPDSEDERNACLTGLNGECPDSTGLADPRWPCLIDDAAVDVPAGGSVWAYIPQHSPPSEPTGSPPARFTLRATVIP